MSLSELKIKIAFIFILAFLISPIFFSIYEYFDIKSKENFKIINIEKTPLEHDIKTFYEPKHLAIDHSVAAIKSDGTWWAWGLDDGYFKDSRKNYIDEKTPYQIKGIDDAVAVVTGASGLYALLREDGTVWAWGRVGNKDIVIDSNDDSYIIEDMRQIDGIQDVVDIAVGYNNLVFLKNNGDVYIMGGNKAGWINGNSNQEVIDKPIKVPYLKDIVRIDMTGSLLLALDKHGDLYSTGTSTYNLGRIARQTNGFYKSGRVILPEKVVDFVSYDRTPMALLENGSVWIWGKEKNMTMKNTTLKGYYIDLLNSFSKEKKPNGLVNEALLPVKHELLHRIVNIDRNQAVGENGDLYVWGTYINNTETRSEYESRTTKFRKPRLIKTNVDPVQLYYSDHVSAVIEKNGDVYFWHTNRSGERGTGNVTIGYMTDNYIFTPEKSLFTIHWY